MKKYYLWTMGCQMNEADSRRLAGELEALGYTPTAQAEDASVAVLNTCVVRQQAEDRIYGRLGSLQTLKAARPDLVLAVMGCLVGRAEAPDLRRRFPFVDLFLPPSDFAPLVGHLKGRQLAGESAADWAQRDRLLAGEYRLPEAQRGKTVAACVPVVLGCSHACSFCVIPYRRGRETSRPEADILHECRALAAQGVREIMLLGQIVDRYGLDLPEPGSLARLLQRVGEIEGLARLRFLTSHPSYCRDELIATMAEHPKVCPQFELPIQSGNDEVLARMRRGYTVAQYRDLVARIRDRIPGVAIHTDVIVGFPGETQAQFMDSYRLLAELRFSKVHLAKYSPRPRTLASRTMPDDVGEDEKERRWRALDELQRGILAEEMGQSLGQTVTVLAEERQRGRWRGRTPQNKLVFFEDERDLRGQLVNVHIEWAGPYSLIGRARDPVLAAAS